MKACLLTASLVLAAFYCRQQINPINCALHNCCYCLNWCHTFSPCHVNVWGLLFPAPSIPPGMPQWGMGCCGKGKVKEPFEMTQNSWGKRSADFSGVWRWASSSRAPQRQRSSAWSQGWGQRSCFSCSQEICSVFSKLWGIRVKAAAELIDPRAVALWVEIITLNFRGWSTSAACCPSSVCWMQPRLRWPCRGTDNSAPEREQPPQHQAK